MADNTSPDISTDENDRKVDAQVVELAFLCLQFVALTCAFTGLNIPDEDVLAGALVSVVPAPMIDRLNKLNQLGLESSVPDLLPPSPCENPDDLNVGGELFEALRRGIVTAAPAPLKCKRIPMTPYEGRDDTNNLRPAFLGAPDRDNGLTVGGIQVGVYGWSFGGHFPGSLPYTLMHHPELARYEAPYSLPLLFNEDEWRNGVQTAGYVSRRIKELAIQKIYRLNRTRYGIEHHTMFFFNTFTDEHGVGRAPRPDFNQQQQEKATEIARERASQATLYMHDHTHAPNGVYTPLEKALLDWIECLLRKPHQAYKLEPSVRTELEKENRREIEAGLRQLDKSPGVGDMAAMERLVNHQIAELAMMIGHMDGLARVLTMLQLEAESGVQTVEGSPGPAGGIVPDLDENGQVRFTGYFNNRPSLHTILPLVGINEAILTLNELLANPGLCKKVKADLAKGKKKIQISANEAQKTGEF